MEGNLSRELTIGPRVYWAKGQEGDVLRCTPAPMVDLRAGDLVYLEGGECSPLPKGEVGVGRVVAQIWDLDGEPGVDIQDGVGNTCSFLAGEVADCGRVESVLRDGAWIDVEPLPQEQIEALNEAHLSELREQGLLIEAKAGDAPEAIELTATLELQAAAGDKRPARFSLTAYTGGAMKPSAFADDVVIDLAGIQARASVPLLADHRNQLESVLGSGRPTIDRSKSEVRLEGTIAGETLAGAHLLKLAAAGVAVQASVGGAVLRSEFVAAGAQAQVNGKTFSGPLRVVREFQLREVSIVPAGADVNTDVRIAATGLPTGTGAGAADAIKAERARISEIRQLVASANLGAEHRETVEQLEAKAIDGELTAAQLGRELLGLLKGSRPTATPGAGGRSSGVDSGKVLAAATLMLAGYAGLAEKAYGAEAVQRAEDLRARHILDIVEAGLTLDGRDVPRERDRMIHAAFSTMSLPTALGGAMDKSLSDAFEEEKPTWISLAREVPVRSFREHTVLRPYLTKKLTQVGPDGELKYVSLAETTDTVKADTFGANLGITRTDLVNDDLQVFADVPRAMGIAARRAMSDEAYTLLLANPDSFFASENGNYQEGAATALSVDSLGEAVELLRKMTDENGRPLNLSPSALLIPPDLEATARSVLNSTEISAAAGDPTGNPMRGIVQTLEVEARLSSSSFTGYSALAWYLFASSRVGALIVAYLNGQRTPTIQAFGLESDPSRLGYTWRIFHDFGFALGEHRGAVKSKGEA